MRFNKWIPILGIWTDYPVKEKWFMLFHFYQVLAIGITTMLLAIHIGRYIVDHL